MATKIVGELDSQSGLHVMTLLKCFLQVKHKQNENTHHKQKKKITAVVFPTTDSRSWEKCWMGKT